MFDVFYQGPKPGLFPFEQPAISLTDAAKRSRTRWFWYVDGQNDYSRFNFDYRPVPWEAHHIHTWPNQWQADGGVYLANKWTIDQKIYNYHTDSHAPRRPNPEYWYIPDNIDPASIDPTWAPDPMDPPYIYQFPVAWGWDRIGGPEYRVPGATEVKHVDYFYAKTVSDMTNWHVPENIDRDSFDFSWVPHPAEEPYIYKFPTVWNPVGGPEYHTPGATQEKYIDVLVAKTLPNRACWTVPEEVNADTVDFSWVPHPQDPPYIYHFGTDYQQSVGLTYTVPGATELKFAGPIPELGQHDKPVLEVLDIFYIDKSNASSAKRFQQLQEKYPHIQKIRYANTMMDTINRCLKRTKTAKFWVISSENIYDSFDFSWHAQPWQTYMTHVFGSQWQKWSDTFLINKYEFERNSRWAASLEEFPNLNFVKDQTVFIPDDLHEIYYIDHGNDDKGGLKRIQDRFKRVKTTRYVNTYLDTFKRIMSTATTEYVWVVSSLCDYSRFDFSWQPEPWQQEMIHVFPSANQARGDTFYIHVESFKQQMVELEILDWFNVINYCEEQRVPRWTIPTCEYSGDNLVETIKAHEFKHPYTWFFKKNSGVVYNPSIWGEKDKKIVSFSPDNSYVLVPREAKNYINTQAYDYPYISKMPSLSCQEQDIIFISYDEAEADVNWKKLTQRFPRAKRLHGVEGMENALQAAAAMSSTDWYYAVFAKTEIADEFNFDFQPDLFQQPKHYIFYAHNESNGLEYGYAGVILYNVGLVKSVTEFGIDYTMSAPHAVIPKISARARIGATPYQAWRSAFRECAKLAQIYEETGCIETQYRLSVWTSEAHGPNADWVLKGANDGVEFYNANKGKEEDLKQAFRWQWLSKKFAELYPEYDQ